MRRLVFGGLAFIVIVVFALAAWDFIKIGRQTPQVTTQKATLIVVEKQARRLTLFRNDQPIRIYQVSLGHDPIGPKQREGDSRTPEGRYSIDSKNGHSRFHLALHISYPNGQDRARAARERVQPGGDIMIHGLPNGLGWFGYLHRLIDWTDGCVAVTNGEIEEIWTLADAGTPVEIKP